jgi:hypothetical protein
LQNKLIFRALTTAAAKTLHLRRQLLKQKKGSHASGGLRVETAYARAFQAIVEREQDKLKIS